MPVVDYLLNSLVKYLQKKQKERKKAKKARKKKKKSSKPPRKRKKTPAKKKSAKKASRKPLFKRKRAILKPKRKKVIKKKSRPLKSKPKKSKKKAIKRKSESKSSNEVCVGVVTHYFSNIKVIVLKMTGPKLCVGERIHLKGRKTDFFQQVKSLQIESVDVKAAKKGQLVGLRVSKKLKEGDKVFKVG